MHMYALPDNLNTHAQTHYFPVLKVQIKALMSEICVVSCTCTVHPVWVWSAKGVSDIFRIFILKSNYIWDHIFLPLDRAHQDL